MSESVAGDGFSLIATQVRECETPRHDRPRAGRMRLGVELTIAATGTRPVAANPFYATLEDAAGARYPSAFYGCKPRFPFDVVRPGATAHGWFSFDVERAASHLTLHYAPARGVPAVSVELGR